MLVRDCPEEDIRAALDVANEQFRGNLTLEEVEDRSGPRSLRYSVKLGVRDLEAPGVRRGYLAYYYGHTQKPKRIRQACYHAHGAWMVALFERQPDAFIRAGSLHFGAVSYRGARGFLREYGSVGEKNCGSPSYPILFRTACNCKSHDTDYIDDETLRYLGWETAMPSAIGEGGRSAH